MSSLPLHIATDGRPLSTRLSGVGRVISQVIEHFPQPERFVFVLYSHAPCHPDFQYLLSQKNVVWIQGRGPTARFGGLWFNLTLPRLLRRAAPALFWGSQQVVPPFLPKRLPVVLTYYDLVLYKFPQAMRFLARVQQRLVQAMSVRRAARILSISAQTQADMIERFGYPGKQAAVAHLGYQPPPRAEQAAASAQAEQVTAGRPFVLSVSTIEPRKNYSTLLEAFANYRRQETDDPYDLVIVGKRGWESQAFYLRLAELQSEVGGIHIVENANDATLAGLYRACAFFAMPTLYEGFGLPLLEALTFGAPCLASDLGCLREIGGERIRYLPATDQDAWSSAITEWVALHRSRKLPRVRFPIQDWTWQKTARIHWEAFAGVL